MKKSMGLLMACVVLLASCGPKPYYKTAKGKKKQKYYNDVQYGGKSPATMKKGY